MRTILAITLGAFVAALAFAGSGSPVTPVPADRWGALQPVSIVVDSTAIVGDSGQEPGTSAVPFGLDIEGQTLFIAGGTGIQIYDITNPARPVRRSSIAGEATMAANGLHWTHSDKDFYITDLDVPDGNDRILVTEADDFGVIVWNTTNKSSPDWHYQDAGSGGRFVASVYATRLADGREYTFGVSTSAGKGLVLYDLTSAAVLTRCRENTAAGEAKCPGVFKGLLSIPAVAAGSRVSGVGDLVIVRSGATNVRVYHVAGAIGFDSLTPRMNATLPGLTAADALLWEHDYDGDGPPGLYLAALGSDYVNKVIVSKLRLFDVSCLRTGPCGLPAPLATYDVTDRLTVLSKTTTLTVSRDNGKPYLYVGSEYSGAAGSDFCADREHLLDLGRFDPSAPPELAELDLFPPTYASWYYQECGGSPGTKPFRARVSGGHLFRTVYGFADAHLIVKDEPEPPPPDPPPDPPPPPPPSECPPCPCCCPCEDPPPPPPDPPPVGKDIFADGFEGGNTSGWVTP